MHCLHMHLGHALCRPPPSTAQCTESRTCLAHGLRAGTLAAFKPMAIHKPENADGQRARQEQVPACPLPSPPSTPHHHAYMQAKKILVLSSRQRLHGCWTHPAGCEVPHPVLPPEPRSCISCCAGRGRTEARQGPPGSIGRDTRRSGGGRRSRHRCRAPLWRLGWPHAGGLGRRAADDEWPVHGRAGVCCVC